MPSTFVATGSRRARSRGRTKALAALQHGRQTAEGEEYGLLFDAMGTASKTGYSATVWACNLFLLPPTFEEFLALPKEVFDCTEELIASGWCVD